MRISMDAKDYISGNKVHVIKWNGREIGNGVLKRRLYTAHKAPENRNINSPAFQTYLFPAEYADERDEGNMLLADDHLRLVVRVVERLQGVPEQITQGGRRLANAQEVREA